MKQQDQDRLNKILELFNKTKYIQIKNGTTLVSNASITVVSNSKYHPEDNVLYVDWTEDDGYEFNFNYTAEEILDAKIKNNCIEMQDISFLLYSLTPVKIKL
jgi:hypothetical protein